MQSKPSRSLHRLYAAFFLFLSLTLPVCVQATDAADTRDEQPVASESVEDADQPPYQFCSIPFGVDFPTYKAAIKARLDVTLADPGETANYQSWRTVRTQIPDQPMSIEAAFTDGAYTQTVQYLERQLNQPFKVFTAAANDSKPVTQAVSEFSRLLDSYIQAYGPLTDGDLFTDYYTFCYDYPRHGKSFDQDTLVHAIMESNDVVLGSTIENVELVLVVEKATDLDRICYSMTIWCTFDSEVDRRDQPFTSSDNGAYVSKAPDPYKSPNFEQPPHLFADIPFGVDFSTYKATAQQAYGITMDYPDITGHSCSLDGARTKVFGETATLEARFEIGTYVSTGVNYVQQQTDDWKVFTAEADDPTPVAQAVAEFAILLDAHVRALGPLTDGKLLFNIDDVDEPLYDYPRQGDSFDQTILVNAIMEKNNVFLDSTMQNTSLTLWVEKENTSGSIRYTMQAHCNYDYQANHPTRPFIHDGPYIPALQTP